MLLVFPISSVKAYVPQSIPKPELISIDFSEKGKFLKYGDTLNATVTLANASYLSDISFYTESKNPIILKLNRVSQNGNVFTYTGTSDPLTIREKEGIYEARYVSCYDLSGKFFTFKLYDIPAYNNLTFTFCNDCYYGRHRGGTATPSKQAVCSICGTPYGSYAKGVTLNATKTTLQAGKTSTALKIEEKNPSDKVKKWTSSNPKVVSVHKKTGKLTAKKTGKATITVTMKSGATAKCKVTVKKSVDKTKKLTIVNVPKLKVGQKYQLIVRRNPVTATEKLMYEVSKNSGVSVNKKGIVMAKRSGSYIVTVKSSNGKRAKVRVNVG